jgi:hypothetical protein
MEVYEAIGQDGGSVDDDRDYLTEIHEYLERLDEDDDESFERAECQLLRFNLCDDCRKNFLLDPLGRRVAQPFDFSKN